MYRKLKPRPSGVILDLDSLMDILSCLVGVMLFLVIYTVLELGSVAYRTQVPVGRDTPIGSERVVVLAEEGTVRVMDTRRPLALLLSGFEIVRAFDELPLFVEGIERFPTDAHFRYSLRHVERVTTRLSGQLDLVVESQEGVAGDSLHQLTRASAYALALDRMSPSDAWLSFAVDSASVEVFRIAREMAIDRGFATSWNQVRVELPLEISLARESEDWLSERITSSKPAR